MIQRDAMTVIGHEVRTSNENPQEIGAAWQTFMGSGAGQDIPGRVDDKVVAVYCDYEGDHTKPYTYVLGCRVGEGTEAPEGMVRRELPAGSYAHYVSKGEQPGALVQTWMSIWGAGLSRAFVCDYEIHDLSAPERIEVFVGVQ